MDTSIYIPAEPVLDDVVRYFWQVDRHIPYPEQETIIPKGVVEIIFNFYRSSDALNKTGRFADNLPRCFLNCYNTRPICITLPDRQNYFGVVLYPTTLKKIFRIPGQDFCNQVLDLTVLDKTLDSLWHRLSEQSRLKTRATLFSDWLKLRIKKFEERDQAFNRFLYGDSHPSVTELSSQLCYSSRQLARKIQEMTGMNTEQTLLHRKYLHAVKLIHLSSLSLTDIAYTCNFFDQSHFIKTFTGFAGITPGEYRNRKSVVIGHIFESVR